MRRALAAAVLAWLMAAASVVHAGGISADTGLTPPRGRWILRSQVRAMSREAKDAMHDMSMERVMIPFVVVHGATPSLTLGLRQPLEFRNMVMNSSESDASGLGDLYVFAKHKVLRINTRSHVVGLSPVLGLEFPTGATGISDETLDLHAGIYGSVRFGFWALDLNLGYSVNGIGGVGAADPEPGNAWELNLAFARQFPVGSGGNVSAAPVLEFTWTRSHPDALDGADLPNSGEEVLSLAPGFKYTVGDLILEALVRIPVAQTQNGMQTEAGNMYLAGVRRMF